MSGHKPWASIRFKDGTTGADHASHDPKTIPDWFRTDICEALYPALTPGELDEATEVLWAHLGPRFGES